MDTIASVRRSVSRRFPNPPSGYPTVFKRKPAIPQFGIPFSFGFLLLFLLAPGLLLVVGYRLHLEGITVRSSFQKLEYRKRIGKIESLWSRISSEDAAMLASLRAENAASLYLEIFDNGFGKIGGDSPLVFPEQSEKLLRSGLRMADCHFQEGVYLKYFDLAMLTSSRYFQPFQSDPPGIADIRELLIIAHHCRSARKHNPHLYHYDAWLISEYFFCLKRYANDEDLRKIGYSRNEVGEFRDEAMALIR